MRLTVGPLPSAVYWRRRAVVLGALLLILVVLYASCGTDSGADPKKAAGKPTPTPAVGEPAPTKSVLTPETGAPPGEGSESADPEATGAAPPQVPADVAPCADDDLTITPIPAKSAVTRRSPVDLRLIVQNSSDRSCTRDVGADFQELRIVKGAETVWSSDHCGPAHGSDPATLAPDGKREFMVTWNGRSSTKCSGGVPAGAVPAAGQYHLLGRVGTKLSSPVAVTLQ